MTVGLGAGGIVGIALEDTMGTYKAPDIYVPILDETLEYTETRYFSQQIRNQTIDSAAAQGPYHVEGDIHMEVDNQYMPYFMCCARVNATKSGSGTPWTYRFTPSSGASSGIGAGSATPKTMSITIVRNNRVFKYCGCVVGQYDYTVNAGILETTLHMMGLSETGLNTDTPPTPSWNDPKLFSAASQQIFTAVSGAGTNAPAFGSPDVTYNGYTFTANDNGAAQNRIVNSRAATYISFGKTDATITSQLDFLDRVEYEAFVATTKRAHRFSAARGDELVQITAYGGVYETYPVHIAGMADLIMADMTLHLLAVSNGSGFEVLLTSDTANITLP